MAGALPLSPSDDDILEPNARAASTPPTPTIASPIPSPPVVAGMVRPTGHHRRLIELTASFVARHGPEFEKRMLPYNPSIARCDFFDPAHPYHAYYQHCLSQLRSNTAGPAMDYAGLTDGIDQPPRCVRKVIEITATSAVEYGLHHEKWIAEVFGDRPTHEFLVPSHPDHAYYQQQIAHARAMLCSSSKQ